MDDIKITKDEAIAYKTSLYKKLSQIQQNLFVPKEKNNDFGKYKYRNSEDILAAVKPLCEEAKTVLTLDTSIELIDTQKYVKAIAYLYDLETGCYIATAGYAREDDMKKGMDASQTTGSATSYARKYAMAGLFGIDNERDQDDKNRKDKDGLTPEDKAATEKKKTSTKAKKADEPVEMISTEEIKAIEAEMERTGISVDAILGRVKKNSLEEMTKENYRNIIKALNDTPDK